MFELTPFGRIVWEDRYALKDENGSTIEKNIFETFKRVAKAIASKEKDPEYWTNQFYTIMADHYFCPAGRILAHSGTHYSQLLNCFVLPFENDSLESIMKTAKDMAIVFKFGGGCGFNYSKLRPSGSYIKGVNGHSCGVPGFIHMMSTISEVIEQGGSRRAASLGLLEVWHPDIWEFISYKNDHNWERLTEFIDIKDQEQWQVFKFENLYKWQMYNVSVGVSDEFFEALKKDETWPLIWEDKEWELYTVSFKKVLPDGTFKSVIFEVTANKDATALWKVKKKVPFPTAQDKFEVISRRKIKAKEIWDLICYNAWADGCPGIINMSTARQMHNIEYVSPLLSGNPCAEQMLSAFSSCNLSSIILSSFVDEKENTFNFEKFKETIHTAIRFADDVIDNCSFPLPEISEKAVQERRIGLGLMGVHDTLIALKLPYDSEEGRKFIETVLIFMRDEAYKTSINLAKEKGSFALLNKKKFLKSGFIKTLPKEIVKSIEDEGIRNATLLTQAPTGSTSALLNASSGCEPWFSMAFQRNTRLGSYEDGCPAYLNWAKNHPNEPKPAYFKTSQEISPKDHVEMLILFSKYIDSSVSKTINLSNSALVKDVSEALLYAMENGVKGITVFRDGCKDGVLVNKDKKKLVEEARQTVHEMQDIKEEVQVETKSPFRKRGNRTVGTTYRIHMQNHNLYITINKNDENELVEVFATVGENKQPNTSHTSGVEDSWAEGLAKMVSLALRAGVSENSIIRNLKNIPSDKPVFTTIGDRETSELIPSPPHAIARAIEEELLNSIVLTRGKEELKGKPCTNCGSINTKPKSPTCSTCLDCGYEACS